MLLPLKRFIPWPVVLIMVLIVLREWNIRRHEGGLGDWPQTGSGAAVA